MDKFNLAIKSLLQNYDKPFSTNPSD